MKQVLEKAEAIAQVGTEQWKDLYFRKTFGDDGTYPTSGTLSASPDIIPNGSQPRVDPSQLISDQNWAIDSGSTTNADAVNYIYLRGQNLGPNKTKGRVYLYYSPASLLQWPYDPIDPTAGWARNPLTTNTGAQYVEVEPESKARFYTKEPFYWVPKAIYNDHYCLIGRVWTQEHPNDPPTNLQSISDFAKFISEHPNMAWRNVVTINASAFTRTYALGYSQGKDASEVYMNLVCYNFPDGSEVEISSATPGPNPQIYARQVVKNPPGKSVFTITVNTEIPANWRSNILLTWYSNGRSAPPGMTYKLDPIKPEEEGSPLSRYAVPLEHLGIPTENIRANGARKGIRLGNQTIQAPPAGDYRVSEHGDRDFAKTSRLYAVGVCLKDTSSSVLQQRVTASDVTITRVPLKTIEADEIKLSANGSVQQQPDADLTFDGDFSNGTEGGAPTQIALRVTSVPLGCEVWFRNLGGDVPIEAGPTQINTDPFTLAAIVDLPTGYQGRLRAGLKLNGRKLPAEWEARLDAIVVRSSDVPEASQPLPVVFTSLEPKPGTLLGRITVS